jgi:predicted nuclease of predicted toxin-antitoxin system
VVWAGDWPSDPGDEEILDRAHQEARVLITLDKDFGELAIVRGHPHRLVGLSTAQQASISVTVLAKYGRELEAGAIITVEAARVRVRPPTDTG